MQEITPRNNPHYHRRITTAPFQFRHEFEVHAIQAEDHGGHGQDGAPAGQAFDDFVLAYRDLPQRDLHGGVDHFAHLAGCVRHSFDVIEDVAVVDAVFLGDDVAVEADQLGADFMQGVDGGVQFQQLGFQLVEILQLVFG